MNKIVNSLKKLGKLGGLSLLLGFGSTIANAQDLQGIEESGVFKIATEDDYAPFNFMTDGNPDGFHKDILVELKNYSHGKFSIQQSILPWTGLLAAVSSQQYDAAITGALITDDRLKVFNFVVPVASAQHYYVKRKGDDRINSIADLNGKTLGVQAGSALLARLPELEIMLRATNGKLGKIVQYQSYPEAYADLANGRLDYVVNAVISINDLVNARGNIFEKGQAVSGKGFVAWPVPKATPELLKFLGDFVLHLKETGKLKELQKKWFGQEFNGLPNEAISSVKQFHQLANLD